MSHLPQAKTSERKVPQATASLAKREHSPKTPSLARDLLALQHTAGNRAVTHLLQTKLNVNHPGDQYEQEADHVAGQMMRMAAPRSSRAPATPENDEQEEALMRKERNGISVQGTTSVPSIVDEVLGSSGQPLDEVTRSFMEPHFGHDFSNVRVYTDEKAVESARAVNALAYTVGRDVVFGAGQYAPWTMMGKRLLAHELTHTLQQSGSVFSGGNIISLQNDVYEQEANSVAQNVLRNRYATAKPSQLGVQALQREPVPPGTPVTEAPTKSPTASQEPSASSELISAFGSFAPKTFAQLLVLSKVVIRELQNDLADVERDAPVRAEAEEWIRNAEAWLPSIEQRGDAPLDQFWTRQIMKWNEDLQKIRKEIKVARQSKEVLDIEQRLTRDLEPLSEAEDRIDKMKDKLADLRQLAFRKGDKRVLAEISGKVGIALDIGVSIHELVNMMREAHAEWRNEVAPQFVLKGEVPEKLQGELAKKLVRLPHEAVITKWLSRINKLLAAVNLFFSLSDLGSPTEVGAAEKGIEAISSSYGSLITLFGGPAHIALYADIYLLPLTKIILAEFEHFVVTPIHEENVELTRHGLHELVNPSIYPGRQQLLDFMTQVMQADDPESVPPVPEAIEKYLLAQRELIESGTSREIVESESREGKIKKRTVRSEIPTTGWWLWRSLDPARVKIWLYYNRETLWEMFYGRSVPERRAR